MDSSDPNLFNHWEIDDLNNLIRLGHKKDSKVLSDLLEISPRKFWASFENVKEKNYALDEFIKYYNKVRNWIKPETFVRIGVRAYTIHNKIDFENFVKSSFKGLMFNKSFFEKYFDSFGIKDFAVILEDKNYRLRFGPMKKDEKPYLSEFSDLGNLEDAFLFFDIDCFEHKILTHDVVNTVRRLHSNVCNAPELFNFKDWGDYVRE